MAKTFDKVTPGGIYRVSGTLRACELLTLQKCKLLGTYSWEPCRNPFEGNAIAVYSEALRGFGLALEAGGRARLDLRPPGRGAPGG